jgi:hypothetical protein
VAKSQLGKETRETTVDKCQMDCCRAATQGMEALGLCVAKSQLGEKTRETIVDKCEMKCCMAATKGMDG